MRCSSTLLSGCAPSTSYAGHAPRPVAVRRFACQPPQAQSNSGPASGSGADASARGAQSVDFEALRKKAQDVATEASAAAQRAYRKLDSEYSISDQAQRAAKRAEEAAKDIDQQYSVRRKLRSGAEEVRRKWPIWQQQMNEFGSTWYGKVVIIGTLALLVSTPFFWKAMNFLLLLWWLSVPLSFLLVDQARKAQAERTAAAEEQARKRNPFADMFRARATAGGARTTGGNPFARGGGSGGGVSKGRVQQDGPVIDAEWTPLDKQK